MLQLASGAGGWFAPPPVGAGAHFYAGAALRTPGGAVVGTLCVLDTQPRPPLSPAQQSGLLRCARQTVCLLELGRATAELAAAHATLLAAAAARDRLREARNAAHRALSRQRKRFTALVADEVRSPLADIADTVAALQPPADAPPACVPSQLISHVLARRDSDLRYSNRCCRALEQLAAACTHLQLTVNGILDTGVEGAESFRLSPCAAGLERAVLAPALGLVRAMHSGAPVHLALGCGARLLRSVAPGVPSAAVLDASRVVQILTKLLTNGLKFAAPGGAGAVTLAVRAEDGSLLFQVSDNGSGIAPERLATIFQPPAPLEQQQLQEQQQQQPLALLREGGLASCARLAVAMGGALMARSDAGSGAVFSLRLPLALPPGPPPPPLPAAEQQLVWVIGIGGGEGSTHGGEPQPLPIAELKPGQRCDGSPLRLLVAEDDRVSQVIMRKLLAHVGATMTLVGDGAAAVDAYRAAPEGHFDLILLVRVCAPQRRTNAGDHVAGSVPVLPERAPHAAPLPLPSRAQDMNMPVLDGPGAARAITALGGRTPMVALTANSGPDAVRRCLDAGMKGHLTKPVRPETLSTLRPFAEGRTPTPEDEEATRVWVARTSA